MSCDYQLDRKLITINTFIRYRETARLMVCFDPMFVSYSVMSLSGDSCSTSSGCVSDLENLSEDPSPDSPVSTTDSVHLSPDTAIKSLPNHEVNKELIISETFLGKVEEVAEEVDEQFEEELIESEIIIDCMPIGSPAICVVNQVYTDDCFTLDFESRVRSDDKTRTETCFQAFSSSFDCGSSLSSNYSKAETASIKSDTGSSGHDSGVDTKLDTKLDLNLNDNHNNDIDMIDDKSELISRPIINGVFKEVNKKCLSVKTEDMSDNCSKTSSNDNNNNSCNDNNIDNTNSNSNSYCCKWTHCDWPGNYDDLVDHIREIHVELQPYQQQRHNWTEVNANNKNKANNKSTNNMKSNDKSKQTDSNSNSNAKKVESTQQYVCLWEGCKVYGKASLSRNWLERHVLEQHSGPRPFKCIVEGCGARFKVQSALERHVNSHFKPCVDHYSNSNCSSDVTNCCPNGSANGSSVCCASNSDINSCLQSMQGLSPFELHLQQTSCATMSAVRCKSTAMDSNNCHHFCGPNGTPNKILKRKKSATKLKRKCFYGLLSQQS
jgi:hypothetical protein